MKAYKNDPKLKESFVAEIEEHRKADQIAQGTYGEENGKWRGCAVGCSIHSLNRLQNRDESTSDHKVYERLLGIPEWLAHLEDTIFEGLPLVDAKKWPTQFAKAIPVGADLEPVKWHFCAFVLKENIDRVLSLDITDELKKQVVDAIRQVLAVHESAIRTGKWEEAAARSAAESAAWSAAGSATWSARSAAEAAARSAAWSAARSAAESAAWSAAESAAWSARSASYKRYAKELLRLLGEAKVR